MICICFKCNVYANDSNHIYTDYGETVQDNLILIPIMIENNTGIMGFKIELKFSKESIIINTIRKGNVLTNGMLSDNHTLNGSKCTILWNGTENVKEDGVLLYLGVTLLDDTETTMELTYSQEDTFNEEWENVTLDLENIKINDSFVTKNIENSVVTEDIVNGFVTDIVETYKDTDAFSEEVKLVCDSLNIKDKDELKKHFEQFIEEYKFHCKNAEIESFLEKYPKITSAILKEYILNEDSNNVKKDEKTDNTSLILNITMLIIITISIYGVYICKRRKK